MRISGTTPSGGSSKTGKSKKTGGTGANAFSSHINHIDHQPTSHTSTTNEIAPVNQYLMLQEVDEESHQRDKIISQGYDALDYLDNIKMGLLNGTLSHDTIARLETLIDSWRKKYNDPQLTAIIDDIELRAKVELAKLDKRH